MVAMAAAHDTGLPPKVEPWAPLGQRSMSAAPDDYWGEVPKAFVTLKPGHSLDESALRAFCRARLAGFKVPKAILVLDDLPKGGTGKIQKSALRAWGDPGPTPG
jgi:acyl-CoA synthetase (AMP-forming)/AMP-acid ligase II